MDIILCICQIHGLYRFLSIQRLLIVKKRYPKIVLIEAIVAIFYLMIAVPFWSYSFLRLTIIPSIDPYGWPYYVGWVLASPPAHFLANIESCRLWLISYHLNYLHSSKNSKWKSQIDYSFSAKNWYLQNISTYGNRNYVLKVFMTFFTLAASICTIGFVVISGPETVHLGQFIDGIFFSVPLTITLYTYYKSPKQLNDNLLFHYEFRATAFIFASGFVGYLGNQVAHYLGYEYVNYTMVTLLAIYSLTSPSLLSTLWMPRKILSMDAWGKELMQHSDLQIMTEILSSTKRSLSDASNKTRSRVNTTTDTRLREILGNQEEFESFVIWMYREFSSESVLAFIELVQYKQYIIMYIQQKEPEIDISTIDIGCQYRLYDKIPKSSMIWDSTNLTKRKSQYKSKNKEEIASSSPSDSNEVISTVFPLDIKSPQDDESKLDQEPVMSEPQEIAKKLYNKYIRREAELEVNISSALKRRYSDYNENGWKLENGVKDLLTVYDDVIETVFAFMRQSYIRFES